jgi:E3 ubiquitin-protein ligase DOA10
MKQSNKLNINILIVLLRPLLIYFIIMVIYLLLFIYYMDPILCEGNETLYDLKANLITETHKYRVHTINYELVVDTYNLMIRRPMSERNYDAELQFLRASREVTTNLGETFGRINSLVTRIQSIEPSFQSPVQSLEYLRITRS